MVRSVLLVLLLAALPAVAAQEALDAEAAYSKGTKLMEEGKYADAIPLLTRAIEAEPAYFAAYINRGHCRHSLASTSTRLRIMTPRTT